ncbi:hypothetical protein WMY93_020066 [Mugilogobius chulae]|uniref:Phosphatidylinositol-specific phospholipase C X domain-containing protein n=1 Tax=Mugilogobius chulae TaxID=88201 RepID=A0AAW0NHC4_9GOBI
MVLRNQLNQEQVIQSNMRRCFDSGLTIPGTHESLSIFGGVLAACQVWTLEEQLKAGVRYLDIYVGIWQPWQKTAHVRDSHWKFWQHMTLDEVFEIVLKYLQDYPTEMVLMKISIRGLFKDTVLETVKKTIDKFKSKIWTDLKMPNLGEVRGKIVLVRTDMIHLGVDRKKSYLLENGELTNIDKTLEQIESTLCQSYIVVNERSMSYLDNAKNWALKVNGKIDMAVKMQQVKKGCLGVVSVDFPGPALISDIINVGHCDCSRGNQGQMTNSEVLEDTDVSEEETQEEQELGEPNLTSEYGEGTSETSLSEPGSSEPGLTEENMEEERQEETEPTPIPAPPETDLTEPGPSEPEANKPDLSEASSTKDEVQEEPEVTPSESEPSDLDLRKENKEEKQEETEPGLPEPESGEPSLTKEDEVQEEPEDTSSDPGLTEPESNESSLSEESIEEKQEDIEPMPTHEPSLSEPESREPEAETSETGSDETDLNKSDEPAPSESDLNEETKEKKQEETEPTPSEEPSLSEPESSEPELGTSEPESDETDLNKDDEPAPSETDMSEESKDETQEETEPTPSEEPSLSEPEETKHEVFNNERSLDSSSFHLDWMKPIPDDALISGLTIPGTHESLSRFGGALAACQVWTLEEQLKAGVRYLDIYVGIWHPWQKTAHVRDSHWKFWQHMTLDEVFEIILKYLQEYSTEMVLMKISIRGLFKDTVLEIVKKTIDKFKSKIWMDLKMPNLGDVRGKIVLVRTDMIHSGVDRKKSYLLENGELTNIDKTLEQIESTLCQNYIVVNERSMSYLDNAKNWALKVNGKLDMAVKMQQGQTTNSEAGGESDVFEEEMQEALEVGEPNLMTEYGEGTAEGVTEPDEPDLSKSDEPAPSEPDLNEEKEPDSSEPGPTEAGLDEQDLNNQDELTPSEQDLSEDNKEEDNQEETGPNDGQDLMNQDQQRKD